MLQSFILAFESFEYTILVNCQGLDNRTLPARPQPPPPSEKEGYTASDGKLSRELGTLYDIAVSCALLTQ